MPTTNNPLVSIVIPCYNAKKYVADAICSAISQTYGNLEVIVVDDGSTDGSLKIIEKYSKNIVLKSGPNRGASHARNLGIAVASGKYVKFLDADDFLLPGCVTHEVGHAETLGDEHIVIGRAFGLDDATGILTPHAARDEKKDRNEAIFDSIYDVPLITAPLYPRDLLIELGGFRTDLSVREDFELFVRAILHGNRLYFANIATFVYRSHASDSRVSKQANIKRSEHEVMLYAGLFKSLLICRDTELRDDCSIALGRSCWITARNSLRLRHTKQALELFSLAKQFSNYDVVVGRKFYKMINRLFGPVVAENVVNTLKKIS